MRRAAALAVVVLFLAACQDDAPTGPTTSDFEAERARLAERIKKKTARTDNVQAEPKTVEVADGGGFGRVSEDYVYDATDKRDPFRSFFMNQKAMRTEEPAGPLEQYELAQLDVTAMIWDAKQPRALISDPRGESYIVREGSRIGKNFGRVIHIGDDLVLVKETYVDFSGEQTTKDVELRIRVSQGG